MRPSVEVACSDFSKGWKKTFRPLETRRSKFLHSVLLGLWLSLGFGFLAPSAFAENETADESGWYNLSAEAVSPTGVPPVMTLGLSPQNDVLGSEIHPEVTELAAALGYDPLVIYEYIRNHYDYVPYYGQLKGSLLTVYDQSGNDVDLAVLLVDLLKVSGLDANLIFGRARVPLGEMANLLGVDETTGTVSRVLAQGGIPHSVTNFPGEVDMDRVWVSLDMGGGNIIQVDPSFKQYEETTGIDLASAMQYNQTELLDSAGGTVGTNFVQNLDLSGLKGKLTDLSVTLLGYLQTNYPHAFMKDIVGGREIIAVESEDGLPPENMPYTYNTSGGNYGSWGTEVPTNYIHTIHIQYGGIDETYAIANIAGRKLALVFPLGDFLRKDDSDLDGSSVSPLSTEAGEGGILPVAGVLPETVELHETILGAPWEEPREYYPSVFQQDGSMKPSCYRTKPPKQVRVIDFGRTPQSNDLIWVLSLYSSAHTHNYASGGYDWYHQYYYSRLTGSGYTQNGVIHDLNGLWGRPYRITYKMDTSTRGVRNGLATIKSKFKDDGGSWVWGEFTLSGSVGYPLNILGSYGQSRSSNLGAPVELQCRLKNSGALPLEVQSLELVGADKDHFELLIPNTNYTLAAGASLTVPVRYESRANGDFEAKVELSLQYDGVKYDGERFNKISLPVIGKTVAAITAKGHDFGITYIDTPRRGVCSIVNKDNDLELTDISITGTSAANFTLISGAETGTIAHSESRYIEVEYVSTTAGAHSAQLEIAYDLNGTNDTLKLPLDGETTDILRAQLTLDDKLLAEEPEVDTNEYTDVLSLSIDHPYAANNDTFADKTSLFSLNRGSAYVLITDFGGSHLGRHLEKEQRKLAFMHSEQNKEADEESDEPENPSGETNAVNPVVATEDSLPLLTQSMQVIGQTWMQETTQVDDLLAQMSGVVLTRHHRLGIVAQEHTGHYIDIKNQVVSTSSKTNSANDEAALYRTLSLFHSAFEHGALEQLQYADSVISTVRLLDVANELGLKIYKVDANNVDAIRPLLDYADEVLNGFEADVKTNGYTLILPESGSVPFNDWKGLGFIKYNENATNGPTFAMIIDSEYHGGYNTVRDWGSSAWDWGGGAINWVVDGAGSGLEWVMNISNPKSAEPVDLATGSYLYDRTDLVTGSGTAPMGMAVKRSYSSQNNFKSGAFGCGWTHNYETYINRHASAKAALGARRPHDAVAILTAAHACLDIMQTEPEDARTWVVESLIGEWAVDQVISNTATLSYRGKRLSYTRMPDGTFIAPPGVNMELTKDANNCFRLEGRYGDVQQFNTNDWLETWSDADGHTLSVRYTDKKVDEIEDACGRILSFEYTANGAVDFIEEIISGITNRKVDYQYDDDRNLIDVIDPEGNLSTFKYDDDHQIIELSNHDQELLVINTYNELGKVTAQNSMGSNVWNFGYAYYQTREENPLGGVNTYYFDETRRQIGFEDASGYKSTSVFDGSGHVIQKTSPAGYETRYNYDGDNRLVSTEYPGGGGISSNQYDALHRITLEIDPEGNKVEYVYNGGNTNNRPDFVRVYTDETQYDETAFDYYISGIEAGNLWKITDPENFSTEHEYDSTYGTLSKVITAGDNGSNNVHQTQYNARGDLEQESNANGIKTAFGYNQNRQRTDTIQYDESDAEVARHTRTFDANGDLVAETGPQGFEKRYAYNPFKKITHAWTVNDTADPNDDPVVTYEYDERDWLVKTTDPMGRETVYEYYPNHQKSRITDPASRITSFTYNDNGEPETVTGPLGWTVKTVNDITNRTTTVTEPYKGTSGDPTAVPDGTPSVTKTFDKAGQMTSLLNRRGNEFELGYDAKGAATDFYTPLSNHTQTAYTSRGAVDTVTEPSGQQTEYSYYPASGRLQSTVDQVGTVTYSYDSIGNITNLTDETDTIQYEYDYAGRVKRYVDADGNELEYRYYDNGNLRKLIYPDDKEVTYAYYTNNLLHTVTDWANRITSYEYYDDNRLHRITRPNGTVRVHKYALDGKLARIEERTSDGHLIALYQYNYNANGTLESRFALPIPESYKLPAQSFTHDEDNRIATHNGIAVTYDDDGNLMLNPAAENNPSNFVYNARNFLTSVDGGSNSTSTVYTYDVAGNRVGLITDNSSTNNYIVNPAASLSQVLVREKNGQKTFYVYGLGLAYEVSEAGDAKYYHYDLNGSTVAISDDAEVVTDRIEYSPYGIVTRRTGNTDTPFLHIGKYGVQTDGNGLLYMRARYYSTELRCFINSDPLRFDGGLNFFAYANGNPFRYIDPLGTQALDTEGERAEYNNSLAVATDAYNSNSSNNGFDALPGVQYNPADGFKAMLRNIGGQWYCGFAGTDTKRGFGAFGRDMWNNIRQGFGFSSPQHKQAMDLARAVRWATGGNVIFSGHSLGGGLAGAASRETGARAITFNAAGLHPWTVPGNAPGDIQNHRIRGEVLSTIQILTPLSNGAGSQVVHPAQNWHNEMFGRHSIGQFQYMPIP